MISIWIIVLIVSYYYLLRINCLPLLIFILLLLLIGVCYCSVALVPKFVCGPFTNYLYSHQFINPLIYHLFSPSIYLSIYVMRVPVQLPWPSWTQSLEPAVVDSPSSSSTSKSLEPAVADSPSFSSTCKSWEPAVADWPSSSSKSKSWEPGVAD